MPSPKSLTHVVMQGGVGSIAAAIFFGFARLVPDAATRFVVVEPAEADCLYRSAVSGRPTRSAGTLNTMMAGLACAEVSPAAWKILWAAEGMRALADGDRDVPIVAGESAAGGMGVLLHAEGDPALRAALGLGQDSRVLLIGGEGATDPVIYEDLTGQAPDEVFARQATVTAARR